MLITSHYKETLFACLLGLCLPSCVPEEPWTREQQAQVTVQTLPVSPAVALRSVERAVKEINPRSTTFDFTPNGFRATRQFSEFMIVAAMQGTYVYDVQVQPAGTGSTVTTKIYADSSAITAAGVSPGTATMWQTSDAYQLLQDRVLYHAGLLGDWVSCQEARARYNTKGAIEPMCIGATASDPAP